MVQEVNELFGTDVELADAPTVVVVLGRGDDAERHEFPYTDIALDDDPMIVDDEELKRRVEAHMADIVAPGELADKKIVRAEGNIVISQANVYGAYQHRSKAEILSALSHRKTTRAFSEVERQRLKELEDKGLVLYDGFDTYRLAEKARGEK